MSVTGLYSLDTTGQNFHFCDGEEEEEEEEEPSGKSMWQMRMKEIDVWEGGSGPLPSECRNWADLKWLHTPFSLSNGAQLVFLPSLSSAEFSISGSQRSYTNKHVFKKMSHKRCLFDIALNSNSVFFFNLYFLIVTKSHRVIIRLCCFSASFSSLFCFQQTRSDKPTVTKVFLRTWWRSQQS